MENINAEVLKEDLKNDMKETREGRVSNKGRNSVIRGNVSYVSNAVGCNEEDTSDCGKSKSNFLKISKDLLISEQINHSGMLSTSPVLNTDISTSHNASNSSIRSTYASTDLSLDRHDEEILSILEELKCSLYQGMVEECTKQCRLN